MEMEYYVWIYSWIPDIHMVYKILGKVDTYEFWTQGCRSLEQRPFNGIQGFKEILIRDFARFTKNKLGWL